MGEAEKERVARVKQVEANVVPITSRLTAGARTTAKASGKGKDVKGAKGNEAKGRGGKPKVDKSQVSGVVSAVAPLFSGNCQQGEARARCTLEEKHGGDGAIHLERH